MAIDPDRFWHPGWQASADACQADIDALEQRHGVELPASWKACMLRQNGGLVRYTDIELEDVESVRPLDERWWSKIENADRLERERVLDLGYSSAATLLWFPAGALGDLAPAGAAGIVPQYDSASELGDPIDFDAFFEEAMRVQQEPPFSWKETDDLEVILAHDLELLDTRPDHHGSPQPVRQVLARSSSGQLVLFSHVHAGHQSLDEYRERVVVDTPIHRAHIHADYGMHCMTMGPVTERVWAERMFDGTWKPDSDPGQGDSCLYAPTREELRAIQLGFMPYPNDPPFL